MSIIEKCECGSEKFLVLEKNVFDAELEDEKLYVNTHHGDTGYELIICKDCNKETNATEIENWG